MIKFRCKDCNHKISVPKIHAGKKGKCPKCKSIVVIPKVENTDLATGQSETGDLKSGSKSSGFDLTFLDIPQENNISDYPITQEQISEKTFEDLQKLEERFGMENPEPDPAVKRKLPWLIDIFLYPASVPGLTILAIIIGVPLLIDIAAGLAGPFWFFLAIPGFVIKIVILLYIYWYYCECISDSAAGGVRAPETLAATPGIGDMAWQLIRIVGCLAFFFAPALIYFQYTRKSDTIFLALLAYAIFFFPMGLLAVILFDSFSALNPLLLIGSVFSVFFQYSGLVLVFIAAFLLIVKTGSMLPRLQILFLIFRCACIYLIMVTAHLLGRFYWRYQDKLNWEV